MRLAAGDPEGYPVSRLRKALGRPVEKLDDVPVGMIGMSGLLAEAAARTKPPPAPVEEPVVSEPVLEMDEHFEGSDVVFHERMRGSQTGRARTYDDNRLINGQRRNVLSGSPTNEPTERPI